MGNAARQTQLAPFVDPPGAGSSIFGYLSQGLDEPLRGIRGRLADNLRRLPAPHAERGLALLARRDFWRSILVLGLAHRTGTLTERHSHIALALELVSTTFVLHSSAAAQEGRLGDAPPRGARDTGVYGKAVLFGDRHLAEALTVICRCERPTTFRAMAIILTSLSAGHVMALNVPDGHRSALRHYYRRVCLLRGEVIANAIYASLAESNLAAPDDVVRGFANALARNLQWEADRRGHETTAATGWSLPMFIAHSRGTEAQRRRLEAACPGADALVDADIQGIIAATGALAMCAHATHRQDRKSRVLLDRLLGDVS